MIKTKEKGGFFGKALAAACSVALVASLTPAAAVSAFAAQTQKAPEQLTLAIEQLGSQGNVVKSATMKMDKDQAAKYLKSSAATSVIYNDGNWGVATVTSNSASTVTNLFKTVETKEGGTLLSKVVKDSEADARLSKATVTIESGYTADEATLKDTGVISKFVQSVSFGWKELENSVNYYPKTNRNGVVTTNGEAKAGALIVQSGHTVFNNIVGQPNTTNGTAADIALLNVQDDQKETAEKNNNGFTFITGITANNANNHDFTATAKMVQGVSKITVTIPYPGLDNVARIAGTDWDNTMIDTLDSMVTTLPQNAANKKLTDKHIDLPDANHAWEPGVFVVATAGGYEDALAASGFAGLINAPLLMTDRNTLTASTKKYIDEAAKADNGTKTIYLIGGNVAVSDEVQAELEAIEGVANTPQGAVIRIAGENSWDTSLELYKKGIELGELWGGDADGDGISDSKEVIVATSIDFQDALSISPYAFSQKLPVILTTNNAVLSDSVAEAMQDAIKNAAETDPDKKDDKAGEITKATFVGGTVVVSPVVNNQLLNIPIERLAGTTAYDTSNDIAVFLTEGRNGNGGMFDDSKIASMATGKLYLDALSSCNFTGTQKTVLLLVDENVENGDAAINGFLTQYGPNGTKGGVLEKGVIFGGTTVVSEATEILANDTLTAPTYVPASL